MDETAKAETAESNPLDTGAWRSEALKMLRQIDARLSRVEEQQTRFDVVKLIRNTAAYITGEIDKRTK